MSDILTDGPRNATSHILLAHGAGAPMTSPFMSTIAKLLASQGLLVSRFQFSYMAPRAAANSRRPPPRTDLLAAEYLAVLDRLASGSRKDMQLIIGGKSMGGRIASLTAGQLYQEGRIAGLLCLGYPFHPAGKHDQLRTAHLETLRCPALIVQGERDPFGNRTEVDSYKLSETIQIHWCLDGDHDLAPRAGQGLSRNGNLAGAAAAIASFANSLRR